MADQPRYAPATVGLTADAAPAVRRDSLAEQIAAHLRTEIIDGTREPGSRLVLDKLAVRYHVSPIPVRDALRRLESEGLVERAATNRLAVAAPNLAEIHDLFELRAWIEAPAARQAARARTPADLRQVRTLWQEIKKHTGGGVWEPRAWIAHQQFHQALLLPGCGKWAARILELVYLNIERYSRLFITHVPVDPANRQHAAMLAALEAGDGDALQQLAREHIPDIERLVTESLHAGGKVPHGVTPGHAG